MTGSSHTTRSKTGPPIGDPAAIVARVEAIENIIQVDGSFERFPVTPAGETLCAHAAPETYASIMGENRITAGVYMACEFTMARGEGDEVSEDEVKPRSDPDRILIARIEGNFIVAYRLSPGEKPDEGDLQAFAATNGVFTVRPYWREFLSNSLMRTGLPMHMAPVAKIGSPREQKSTTEAE